MIAITLLAVTLAFAVLSLLILRRGVKTKLPYAWPFFVSATTLAAFVYLYGAWVFVSIYLRYLFAFCFVVALIYGLGLGVRSSVRQPGRGVVMVHLVIAAVFALLSVLYFTGTTGKPYGIARLKLPFSKGEYLVFQGGRGLPTNVFHYGLRGAVYAMDLVKLNALGNRANSVFSSRLNDYETFNDTILSPCNGVILESADNNVDNIPPERRRGPTNTNHVLIGTDSFYVFMGHMKYHSVFVQAGDSVWAGRPIGLAGNSGFSLEPHLHIQVHARTSPALRWFKEKPLWIEFDGRSYLLFDVIDNSGNVHL